MAPAGETGIAIVYPIQVFRAMHALRRQIDPVMLDFFYSEMSEDRRTEEPPIDGWLREFEPWTRGRQRYNQITTHAMEPQALYTNFVNGRIDAARYMLGTDIDGSWSGWSAIETRSPEQIAKENAARKDAETKAMALLERVVTPVEFECFEKNKYIEVVTDNFIYRIKSAGQTVILTKDWKTPHKSACLQLTVPNAPQADRVVMEYLLIKNDEPRYLRTANLFNVSLTADGSAGFYQYVGNFMVTNRRYNFVIDGI
jgi:hypothetical protein